MGRMSTVFGFGKIKCSCLKNCDADAAGQKLENLFKRGMVWERARSSRREG